MFRPASIEWEEVTALSAAIGLIGAATIWAVNALIAAKLAEFLRELNGTYLRRELAEAKFQDIQIRLDERCAAIHGIEPLRVLKGGRG